MGLGSLCNSDGGGGGVPVVGPSVAWVGLLIFWVKQLLRRSLVFLWLPPTGINSGGRDQSRL